MADAPKPTRDELRTSLIERRLFPGLDGLDRKDALQELDALLAAERERCAVVLDELAQDADTAAYACLGGGDSETDPGEFLDEDGLTVAAAEAGALRTGAERLRGLT